MVRIRRGEPVLTTTTGYALDGTQFLTFPPPASATVHLVGSGDWKWDRDYVAAMAELDREFPEIPCWPGAW